MKSPFFSRRTPLPFLPSWFINAMLILCIVFFLVPFAMRGARMSLRRMKNDVKDWLPSDFKETTELEWFGRHFAGERFIVVSGPWCREGDQRYELFLKKIRSEIPPPNSPLATTGLPGEIELPPRDQSAAAPQAGDAGPLAETESSSRGADYERLRARRIGDKYGLSVTGSDYENWGNRGEKWLQGEAGAWYFLTPDGELFRWDGRNDLLGWIGRSVSRNLLGQVSVDGEHVATVGESATFDSPNEFYQDPRKLTARLFRTVRTGPEVFDELTQGKGSHLWPIAQDLSDEEKRQKAQQLAYERLTGTLFGPVLPKGFNWELSSFQAELPPEKLAELPDNWKQTYAEFVDKLVERYDGDRTALVGATEAEKTRHWLGLFQRLGVEPPSRHTCIVLTLTEVGKKELSRVVGRPVLGKPPGKLIDLAVNECGIAMDDLRLGGPPVDNVAIDEEGQITLVRLIGFSAAVGIGLSLLCFRSVLVTIMVFFVGGISAIGSLSIVWWSGRSVDAVLLSMPSLVYVLGLSGAVHIVNYYRDAVKSHGLQGAPERALAHGWGPCTLAAFTTAIGLLSLYASNIIPIRKFGLFSAIGVVATLSLLFTYLPSALQIWEPGFHRKKDGEHVEPAINRWVEAFWDRVGGFIIRRHGLVAVTCLAVFCVLAVGLTKINTSVQLLKLFDSDAKIIRDYTWFEKNLGKLTPMELVVRVAPEKIRPPLDAFKNATEAEKHDALFQYSLLERMEMAARVQRVVEHTFGEQGADIVGGGMSAATFAPPLPAPSGRSFGSRSVTNTKLEDSLPQLMTSDYLRIDSDPAHQGSELWRVSLRLGALNTVDYGRFVHDLKNAVEPVMAAYETRDEILRGIDQARGGEGYQLPRILVLGAPEPILPSRQEGDEPHAAPRYATLAIDDTGGNPEAIFNRQAQTPIFAQTLQELLINAGADERYLPKWIDPESEAFQKATPEEVAAALSNCDCVVLVNDLPGYDLEAIRQHAPLLVDARDHHFHSTVDSPAETAADKNAEVQAIYTGVVPVVYKAQRTLLTSLVDSIFWAFVLIAGVMMVLLRDWGAPLRPWNLINIRGGLLSMAPNVFPVVLIFGAMGFMDIEVDIGSMMTASVAMGVAVDDTIHFLSWFRKAVREGATRREAIRISYGRVATAMTQTTLIGGLGLAVFALSTFTPTQRFGTLMLTLLATALVGDLIFLPAILAGPLGKYFCPREKSPGQGSAASAASAAGSPSQNAPLAQSTLHSSAAQRQQKRPTILRRDTGHHRLGE